MTEQTTETPSLATKLETEIKQILKAHTPADLDANKILDRAGITVMTMGCTRTSVLGSLVYFGLYAQIVGLDGAEIRTIFDKIMAAAAADPRTPELAEKYAKMNAEAKAQAAVAPSSGPMLVLPGDGKVH